MIDWIQTIDADALLWINSHHTEFFDRFFKIFTGRYVWIAMYVSLLAMMVKAWGWKRAIVVALLVGACVGLADQFCATLLRPVFARPRPSQPDSGISELVTLVNGYRGGHYGFPSCHGANSFALVVAVGMAVRSVSVRWMLIVWAVLNCYTRMYLGVHYPGDILVGAAIGSAIAWGVMTVGLRHMPRLDAPGRRAEAIPMVVAGATVVGIAVAAIV